MRTSIRRLIAVVICVLMASNIVFTAQASTLRDSGGAFGICWILPPALQCKIIDCLEYPGCWVSETRNAWCDGESEILCIYIKDGTEDEICAIYLQTCPNWIE